VPLRSQGPHFGNPASHRVFLCSNSVSNPHRRDRHRLPYTPASCASSQRVKQPWSATGFTVSSSLSIFAWALPSGVAVFPCPSSSSGPSFSSTFGPLSCGVLGRLHREFMEIGISIGGNRSRCARVRRSVRIVSRSESRGVGRDAIPLCDNRPCQTLNGIASMRSRRTRGHAMGKKMKNNNQKNRYDVLDDYLCCLPPVFHPPSSPSP
jgi:hypothetical protein